MAKNMFSDSCLQQDCPLPFFGNLERPNHLGDCYTTASAAFGGGVTPIGIPSQRT